jgi:ATPase subunit of ABC transporter with duplicated ATPase domains
MITVTNLTKTYGAQPLFADVTLQLNGGERYGIVGANGSGKSTFLRILTNQESASSGDVATAKRMKMGFLRQDHFRSDEQSILEVAMMGDELVWTAMSDKDEMLAKPEAEFDADRYADLEDLILQHDGYALEARAGEVLEGLGIPTAIQRNALGTLSGGFKLRVLLAQALAAAPDALLLDEPTNHLDILSVRWLEKFLLNFSGCVLVVSHDHRFLDNVCTRILDVDYEGIISYKGNYTAFITAKQEHRDRMEAEITKREGEIAHHQAFIDRFKAKASKARQASSKKKLLDRISIERLPQTSRRYPKFKFGQVRSSGREPLVIDGVSKAFGDNIVLKDVSLDIQRGDRLAIIGPNGIGKSTLLKVAMGELEPDVGTAEWGYEAHPGYFAQDHRASFGGDRANVLAWLWDFCPGKPESWVRGLLGAMLFTKDDVGKLLSNLSGGEAARLTFARFMVREPNILVLDEPTNHLDLEAIEALVIGLQAYEGTLIFVSHDRWFVNKLATRILEITPTGITDYRGSYTEYLAHCGDDHLDGDLAAQKARLAKKTKAEQKQTPAEAPLASKQKLKDLRNRRDNFSTEIERNEERMRSIEEMFCRPDFFEKSPRDEVSELQAEQGRLKKKTEKLMAKWEKAEEALGQLESSS